MANKVNTYWFVEPIGKKANQAVYDCLNELSEQAINHSLKYGEGESLEVWEVPHKIITRLYHSKEDLNLRFRVYNRRGPNGKVRRWIFEERTDRKRRKREK